MRTEPSVLTRAPGYYAGPLTTLAATVEDTRGRRDDEVLALARGNRRDARPGDPPPPGDGGVRASPPGPDDAEGAIGPAAEWNQSGRNPSRAGHRVPHRPGRGLAPREKARPGRLPAQAE